MALDYAHDAKTFATAGKDNIIRIYDFLRIQTTFRLIIKTK